jgi:hypothetical protein
MNWKGFGRKRQWRDEGTIPVFAWRDIRKPRIFQSEKQVPLPRFELNTSLIEL